jgi:cyclopropane-fatty-acyl-phospholipid synthase
MSLLQKALDKAGITINGNRPHDVRINNPRAWIRIFFEGTLGTGESYEDGDWDCDDISELTNILLTAGANRGHTGLTGTLLALAGTFQNQQTVRKSRRVAKHYNLSPEFYKRVLGDELVYTCGYWKDAATLAEAQRNKLTLVSEKIHLEPGHEVLDVGCGWGSYAEHAVRCYGSKVTGITIAKEQAYYARKRCEGLPARFEIEDYRDHHGTYDRIVSIGMFEQVGPRNFRTFFEKMRSLLKPDGFFLLHTIVGSEPGGDPWLEKYIFPGGYLPTAAQIEKSIEGLFVSEDVENFGADYDKTLCAWRENLKHAEPELLVSGEYDERFFRRFNYYFGICAGSFRARKNHVKQYVLSPNGVKGGWRIRSNHRAALSVV